LSVGGSSARRFGRGNPRSARLACRFNGAAGAQAAAAPEILSGACRAAADLEVAMSARHVQPTGRESPFADEEIIVSKTDVRGWLTYTNDVFQRVSQYSAEELLGQPHSIIRHPDMPRAIFKLLWETIEAGGEIFAYVLNMAKNGDHYWVFAHVTPSFDPTGKIIGYHSNRRKPKPDQIAKIAPIYRALLEQERAAPDRKIGMNQAYDRLVADLRAKGVSYDQFAFSI
jgi:PAS domain S-box-containing protein